MSTETHVTQITRGSIVLRSMRVVDFGAVSSTENQPGQHAAPGTPGLNPYRHGNFAQWAAVVAAILIGIASIGFTLYFHQSDSATKASDEHTGWLIEGKLQPAVRDMETYIDKQLTPINNQLGNLNQEVGQLQGRFQQLDSGQKKLSDRVAQQEALARLQDPKRILATIRAEIQLAEQANRSVQSSDLADYRAALRTLSPSTENYWITAAAIINYQSLLNQMSGEAPDPAKVAKPCISQDFIGNVFEGVPYRNCIVSLDTNAFEHVTFQDSVIEYQGGPVSLTDVRFINCRFNLQLTAQPGSPAERNLMLALLDSPDQKIIQVSK